jgi:hypothetical protein
MAPEPISTAYFINTSHRSVYLNVYVARQRLGKNVTTSRNARAAIELLETSFSVRSVSYQRKI